jgi:glycosyltransferase involved in cell wall biosynthesis
LRIVHALHAFPPFSRAGCENYVETLARAQQKVHEVSVFHRVADPEQPEYAVHDADLAGLPVVRVNRTFRDLQSFRDTYESDGVARVFGAYLDRAAPDVVHFHHVTCLSTTCVGEARRRGIRVVFTLHDFWLLCPRGQLLRRDLALCDRHGDGDCVRCMAHQLPIAGGAERVAALDARAARIARWPLPEPARRLLARAPFAREADAVAAIRERTAHMQAMCREVDCFVAPSQFLAGVYAAWGIPAERITVADNGFAQDRARLAREPRGDDRRLRVAYLGTWIPSKGVHLLIEAFRDLAPERAVLDVHGYAAPFDGFPDYEGHLRRIAGTAPHIRFHGPYQPEDVPGLLARADLMVVPSIWYENSPLTIHEAFLAGVPVVVADHGGMREFVQHDRNGLRFAPGDVASLRSVLQRAIDEPELVARLAASRTPVPEIGAHARLLDGIYEGSSGANLR